jgi:hypothetical protein
VERILGIADAEEGCHLFVEEAAARLVGLDPFAVENELRDGTLAYVGENFVGGARGVLDVDLFEGYVVPGEEALRFAAVAAPGGRVYGEFHASILALLLVVVADEAAVDDEGGTGAVGAVVGGEEEGKASYFFGCAHAA